MQEILNNVIKQENQPKSQNLSKSLNKLKLNKIDAENNIFK